MNPEEDTFVTYRRRKSRYTKEQEFELYSIRGYQFRHGPNRYNSDRGKGTRQEEDRLEFCSLVSALNDLAKGQKEVLHSINMLALKPKPGHNSIPLSPVDRGSTSSSGKHAYTNMQNTPHMYNKPSRPIMPHSWRMQ